MQMSMMLKRKYDRHRPLKGGNTHWKWHDKNPIKIYIKKAFPSRSLIGRPRQSNAGRLRKNERGETQSMALKTGEAVPSTPA